MRFDGTRLVSRDRRLRGGDTTTLTEGTFIDVTGTTISVDPTEMSFATFGDDTQSVMSWVFDPVGPNNPTLSFGDHTISFGNSTVIFFEDDPIVMADLAGNGGAIRPALGRPLHDGHGEDPRDGSRLFRLVDTADLAVTGVTRDELYELLISPTMRRADSHGVNGAAGGSVTAGTRST